jgi:hypothetical protein
MVVSSTRGSSLVYLGVECEAGRDPSPGIGSGWTAFRGIDPSCSTTHPMSLRMQAVRRDIARFPLEYEGRTHQTHTGPTSCRARVMGAQGFEPPTPCL